MKFRIHAISIAAAMVLTLLRFFSFSNVALVRGLMRKFFLNRLLLKRYEMRRLQDT